MANLKSLTSIDLSKDELLEKIADLSGEDIFACYHCGKCSGSCPYASEMDQTPRETMEYLMDGRVEILDYNTIWLCSSCLSCSARCPNDIDIACVMEALRQIILRKGVDYTELSTLTLKEIGSLPQIALVSNFRKQTG